ncbi:MAG: hypothetical protein M3478_11985 [Planctomycetota bacterium]|nr:hypothetical protein [Planctomycetota bacterium]
MTCLLAAVTARPHADTTCDARASLIDGVAIAWHSGAPEDRESLNRWCEGVGRPLVTPAPVLPAADDPPALEDLAVISWNHHLSEGQLVDLIADLRAGRLTDGRPIRHFVLLLQELYRRGADVPPFAPTARSAIAIQPRDPRGPDARDYATALGLSQLYVPSMRNGAQLREDRGNAIISTEPWSDAFAVELPLERQRRVAVGFAIDVKTARGTERLHVLNAHLEPLGSPSSLWVFRNPRRRQMAAIRRAPLAAIRPSRRVGRHGSGRRLQYDPARR